LSASDAVSVIAFGVSSSVDTDWSSATGGLFIGGVPPEAERTAAYASTLPAPYS